MHTDSIYVKRHIYIGGQGQGWRLGGGTFCCTVHASINGAQMHACLTKYDSATCANLVPETENVSTDCSHLASLRCELCREL
jgi:hypothetical protein